MPCSRWVWRWPPTWRCGRCRSSRWRGTRRRRPATPGRMRSTRGSPACNLIHARRARRAPSTSCSGRDGKLYAAVASGNILRMNPDGTAQRGVRQHRRARARLRLRRGGQPDRRRCGQGPAVHRARPHGHGAGRQGRRRPDPICRRGGRGAETARSTSAMPRRRFAPADWGGTFEASVLDILEQSATGRILEYDPATQDDAHRRAGPELRQRRGAERGRAAPCSWPRPAATACGRSRWPRATSTWQPARTQATVLFDNLPGYPDNLMRGLDGRIWVGCRQAAQPHRRRDGRQALAARGDAAPAARAVADAQGLRPCVRVLPKTGGWWPTCRTRPAAYPETTGVTETADRLYMQSLHLGVLGWKPR